MVQQLGIAFGVILFMLLPTIVETQSGTDVNNLLTQLFTTNGYNKKVRPLTDQAIPVTIAMDFYLSCKYISNFRCSCHSLMVENGSHIGIDRHLRFCFYCFKDKYSRN